MQPIWQITLYAKACLSAWHTKLLANAWLTPLLKASSCHAITEGKFLPEISLDEYKKFSDLFEADLLDALKLENCVAARTSYGGPAFTENDKQFVRGDEIIAGQKAKVEELKQKL